MSITLTDRAAEHVSRYLSKRGRGIGLRVGVQTSGCSGMAYRLEYADLMRDEDRVFESKGVRLVVDATSLPYVDGTELDFVREGLSEGFKFNNPNAQDTCGCGQSFKV